MSLFDGIFGDPNVFTEDVFTEDEVKISQSLIKYLNKDTCCPEKALRMYIRNERIQPNERMLKGMWFEYWITGSVGVSGKLPAEPTYRGKRYADFERMQEQAEFVRQRILPYLEVPGADVGYPDLLSDVELDTTMKLDDGTEVIVRGRLDSIAQVKGDLAVIDFKATESIDEYWRYPSAMDHTQAYIYLWLLLNNKQLNPNGRIPDFYYIVCEWSKAKDYEIIKVQWDSTKYREVSRAINQAYEKIREFASLSWPAIPHFYECKECSISDTCRMKAQMKPIKTVS